MKSIKVLLSLLAILIASTLTKPASALPASCYQYTSVDGFDSPSDWSPWNGSQFGTIIVGPAPGYGAHSGNTADVMIFPWFEPTGGFLLTDKVFTPTTDLDPNLTTRFPSRGCPVAIPPVPTGTLLYCSAYIWIKPLGGANGFFQLLASDYTYLATASFNFAPSTTWQKVSIVDSLNCQTTMVVRVGISRTSSSSVSMVADDLDIVWAY